MSDINELPKEIVDKNDRVVHHADKILYNNLTYVVMLGKRYGEEWIGYPCGNNPSVESIILNNIKPEDIEVV